MKGEGLIRAILVGCLALLVNGCATSVLWEDGRFARFHEPDNPRQLILRHSEKDDQVLVQYREVCDDNEKTRQRAYWLAPNLSRIQERKKPAFISTKVGRALPEIPIVSTAAEPPPNASIYAVVLTNGDWDFALYSQTGLLGQYQLPVYRDASGRVKQVLLTPFTVAADATIIGGALAVWVLPGFADTPFYEGDYR